jgi:plasmid replication initiation protein
VRSTGHVIVRRTPGGQLDLFVPTTSDVSPKEQQDLMSRCWFSLSKRKRYEPIEHQFGDTWVRVSGSENSPIATIFDNDLLLYLISHLMFSVNNGHPVSRRIRFTGYDFFTFIGIKHIGGNYYDLLWNRMERLNQTLVQTNLRIGRTEHEHAFHWLSEIHRVKEGRFTIGYEVVMPEWLYSSVVNDKSVLTLNADYFHLRGGLNRWLYLWARKSAGNQQNGWSESPESLYMKSGSMGPYSEFNRAVRKIVNEGSVLDYSVERALVRRSKRLLFINNKHLPSSRKPTRLEEGES